MLVYVLNKQGRPLMLTRRFGKVRKMLRAGEAKVIRREPFTIQLQYETGDAVQDVTLGIDAGSKTIGLSASTENEELYASEVELRGDQIVKNLTARRECRRARRNRKTRYRKVRFNNRVHSKHKGWLAPSVEQKIDCHVNRIGFVCSILPVSEIIVEVAQFDTELLKATIEGKPIPEGIDYQQGEQAGFWNLREYILYRDNHKCRCCNGKSKDNILEIHHIIQRKDGGTDRPANLITLCKTCHDGYHKGTVALSPDIKKSPTLKDASFMGIMRWELYNRLKALYPNVHMTYGYKTKNTRIEAGLPKAHAIDALCIAGHPNASRSDVVYYQRKVRCHNRQIHKMSIGKGGYRKLNQAAYEVKGFCLFDKVKFNGRECFVFGRRTSGSMDVRTLDGIRISPCAGYKKLKLISHSHGYLTERRSSCNPHV